MIEGKTELFNALVHSPNNCKPEQDWTKAGSQKLHPGLPHGYHGRKYQGHDLLLPRCSYQEAESDGKQMGFKLAAQKGIESVPLHYPSVWHTLTQSTADKGCGNKLSLGHVHLVFNLGFHKHVSKQLFQLLWSSHLTFKRKSRSIVWCNKPTQILVQNMEIWCPVSDKIK